MAQAPQLGLTPSVLDRLLDEDRAPPGTAGERVRYLRDNLRRDLEALLNTRQRCLSTPPGLTEAEASMINYGIPDFSGVDLASEEQRHAFEAQVERAIRRFEPRLRGVRVEVVQRDDLADRTLRFRIEAEALIDPDWDPLLVFDSVMEPVSGNFTVAQGTDRG